jgi:CubicO group peptidase (beta-lactamase class C family)
MPDSQFFAESPESVGIDSSKLEALFERAEKEVREGLLPSVQIAVARQGQIAAMRTFGSTVSQVGPDTGKSVPASDETLYIVYSATKAITSAAAWILIQEGRLRIDEKVADIVPEFGSNGKGVVTVEQLFTHTAGFPAAPYPQREWNDRQARLERFASWRLDWEPGSRFIYHPTSSMWVLAEIIERRASCDYREFVKERIAAPLGLPDLRVGLPPAEQQRIADVVHVGEELTKEERAKLGWPDKIESEVSEPMLQGFNDPAVRQAGAPGAGGIMTAAELALFYQALLNGGRAQGGAPIWKPETIEMARQVRSGDLRDMVFDKPASRGLGLIIAGDKTRNFRGFGHTNSELAFGHNGAGGQLAWGDPASGISLGYCTNAHDRNELRQGRRGVGISSRAAACTTDTAG